MINDATRLVGWWIWSVVAVLAGLVGCYAAARFGAAIQKGLRSTDGKRL